jgi:outer membrane protein assembly factor BamB
MSGRLLWLGAIVGTLSCSALSVADTSDLVVTTAAAQHGLVRAWFNRAQVDSSRAEISHVLVKDGTVFIQTSQALLQAIDAETGHTLWAEQVGRVGHPSTAPAANDELVAVINSTNLFVLNRATGRLLWQTPVEGVPGAGPALSSRRVYVPTTTGMVYSYRLKPVFQEKIDAGKTSSKEVKTAEQKAAETAAQRQSLRIDQTVARPLACQSWGRALVQPLVTRQDEGEEYLVWPTDRGYMFVGAINRHDENAFPARYRLETNGEIVAPPSYLPPDPNIATDSGVIFAVSRDGFVHAIRENNGESLWRFSTGEPIVQGAPAIGDNVYVTTQAGGMYCLDAKTGKQRWWTPGLMQFVAASKERVYATDRVGRIDVLDMKTGAMLDTIPTPPDVLKIMNTDTDRIYLVHPNGLIQCLHETALAEPVKNYRPYVPPKPPVTEKAPGEEKKKPKAKPKKDSDEEPAPRPKPRKPRAKPKKGAAAGGLDTDDDNPPARGRKKKKKDAFGNS